jgi:protein phosphatase/serine/threonine-protein phosphatase Stp1
MPLASSACTHPGAIRPRNEDRVVARPEIGLWAVADGAGGHGAGDVASSALEEALAGIPPGLTAAELLAQVRLRVQAVHGALQARAAEQGAGRLIASTLVVLLVRATHFAALWAGDSRAYLLRGGALHRVTHDHSLVQEMVDAGTLAPEDAEAHPNANIITRAVGQEGELVLDKVAERLHPGDLFLLCSDGVFKELSEPAIAELLREGAGAEALVEAAVRAGGRDNVSAVVVRA